MQDLYLNRPNMKSVLVIFNGIKFPYYLIEYSIAQAKAHAALLHVLFVIAKEEKDKGYGFPSDLSQTETLADSEDALKDDLKIIRHNMKLAADMAAEENIPCTTEILTGSSLEETLIVVNKFDLVCLDSEYDDDSDSMLTNNRFKLNDLVKQVTAPVKLVADDAG